MWRKYYEMPDSCWSTPHSTHLLPLTQEMLSSLNHDCYIKCRIYREQLKTSQPWLCVSVAELTLPASCIRPWLAINHKRANGAPLYHEGPLECLHIIGKKATAWRMNQSIEPVLSLTSSLPFSLLLVQFSFLCLSLPIFSSFASRSVLSWNIYSSPGPTSLNRHTNSQLNIDQCSLQAFPSVSSPKTQRSAIHTRSALAMSPSASPG